MCKIHTHLHTHTPHTRAHTVPATLVTHAYPPIPTLPPVLPHLPTRTHRFHTYDSTVTHGFGPIKMTLDLHKPDASASAALALKVFDAKALGCCGKKITGGTGAVSTCVVNLCTAGAYKPSYCSESADTLKGLATCAANVASCSLKACALHCLGGACSAGCTACVKGACDAGPTGIFACMAPLGYTPPPNCDGSLKSC